MTEKTLNAIEIGAVTVLSAGVDFVVDKTITNAVKPKTIPEKILTGVGIVGVDLACDYGIYRFVHGLLHPSETAKYEMLVQENIKAIETCSEVSKATNNIYDSFALYIGTKCGGYSGVDRR